MTSKIRRRRANYLLLSESTDMLRRLIGKPIKAFSLGTRYSSTEEFYRQALIREPSELLFRSHGGPLFLTFEDSSTVIFYDDDFLGSLVARETRLDIANASFFDRLESDDRMGERVKIRRAEDLSSVCPIIGMMISAIAIYKLPNNYYYKPNGYDLIGECVLSLSGLGVEDVLLVGEIKTDGGAADIRLATWAKLDKDSLRDLNCIWSSEDTGKQVIDS
jgi:hypothetical protein